MIEKINAFKVFDEDHKAHIFEDKNSAIEFSNIIDLISVLIKSPENISLHYDDIIELQPLYHDLKEFFTDKQ